MTEELKPCPFCGSPHIAGSVSTGAKYRWNTRADSEEVTKLRARIAELESVLTATSNPPAAPALFVLLPVELVLDTP